MARTIPPEERAERDRVARAGWRADQRTIMENGDTPLVDWGPGWQYAGLRDRVEQDATEAALVVHDVRHGDTVASLDIRSLALDDMRGAITVGIELTRGDLEALYERLGAILHDVAAAR